MKIIPTVEYVAGQLDLALRHYFKTAGKPLPAGIGHSVSVSTLAALNALAAQAPIPCPTAEVIAMDVLARLQSMTIRRSPYVNAAFRMADEAVAGSSGRRALLNGIHALKDVIRDNPMAAEELKGLASAWNRLAPLTEPLAARVCVDTRNVLHSVIVAFSAVLITENETKSEA